jgi:hypothetical protein
VDAKTGKDESYLTELILALHHEVQSAVDYLAEVAAGEGTELGRGPVAMGVERLRLKVPFRVFLEQKMRKVAEVAAEPGRAEIVRNLAARRGFLVDRGAPGKFGLYSKVRVALRPAAGTEAQPAPGEGEWHLGEIEISFAPVGRE